MSNDRKPDAIYCGKNQPSDRNGWDRDFYRKKVFGPILGSERVDSRGVGQCSLITRHGDSTTFLYPKGDARHPDMQHEWFVTSGSPDYKIVRAATSEDFDGKSVLFGFLKDNGEKNA